VLYLFPTCPHVVFIGFHLTSALLQTMCSGHQHNGLITEFMTLLELHWKTR